MTAKEQKRQPISTGSEWTFELIQAYDKEISRLAARYALDTYPNQIEVITAEQMMDAYASVGMPLGYHHWSYGKHFLSTEKSYSRGQMGLAYEIVINSDPCIAYLMEENTICMQALVVAHACYGHNSFFKGNYLFRTWTDASSIIDYLVFAKQYIMQCEERHGIDAVEQVLDACHALMNYGVDRYKRPTRFPLKKNGAGKRTGKSICRNRSTICGAPFQKVQTNTATRTMRVSPPNLRKTSCTSSKNTRRYWSPGSGKSCGSCARLLNTFIHNARPR
jgi:spore cortex formation protein SpoVR/YcgB (stage V sporulation)